MGGAAGIPQDPLNLSVPGESVKWAEFDSKTLSPFSLDLKSPTKGLSPTFSCFLLARTPFVKEPVHPCGDMAREGRYQRFCLHLLNRPPLELRLGGLHHHGVLLFCQPEHMTQDRTGFKSHFIGSVNRLSKQREGIAGRTTGPESDSSSVRGACRGPNN